MKAFGTADVVAPEHWQHYKGSLRNISEYKGHLVEVGQSTFRCGVADGVQNLA